MLSSQTLYRLGAGALIVGSLLILISSVSGALLFPDHSSTARQVVSFPWQFIVLLTMLGSLLFVIGLPAMYLRQFKPAGVLGLIGFILLFFDILLQGAIFSAIQLIVLPFLAQKAPQLLSSNSLPVGAFLLLLIAGVMHMTGTILFGIATMRARVFPRAAGILLLVSGIAFILTLPNPPSPLGDILEVISFAALTIAFMWTAYLVITGRSGNVEQASIALS